VPRPPVEVADVIRAAEESFFQRSQKWFTWLHLKVLNAILRCRTAALGGHLDACSGCGHRAISFNSCLMGSNSLWGVARREGMLRQASRHFHSPLRLGLQKCE
jgi:Transposase zinc-binding domain